MMEKTRKKFPVLMNNLCYILIAFCFLVGCKNTSQSIESTENIGLNQDYNKKVKDENESIVPDTTINRKIKLEDYNSTESFYPDYKNLSFEKTIRNGTPIVIFNNNDKSQYLLAYQYEGGTLNAFSCFEIGLCKDENINKLKHYITGEDKFKTENGIELGMTLDSLISKKGNNYILKLEIDSIITYRINNPTISVFLKRYKMSGYFMEFKIRENKVQRILFGFDYP